MPFPTTFFGLFVIIASEVLDFAFIFFAIRRRLYRSLLFFLCYVILLVSRGMVWLWISHTPLFRTLPAFYFYWISDAALSILRLATIIEICWRSLRSYPAVWAFAWRILTVIGIALFSWAVVSAMDNTSRARFFVTTGMQRFEFMQAVLLLIVLAIGVYYRIHIPRLYFWVLIGICIYSAVQVANYQLGRITIHPTNSVYDLVRQYSFTISEIIWIWAVFQFATEPLQQPKLIPQAVYDKHSGQIHDRLRVLNDSLAALLH
jgi:hypothetical protein